MIFKYRWLYALGISIAILLIGFFYMIQPQLTDLNQLRLTKQSLKQSLDIGKNNTVESHIKSNQILNKQERQIIYMTDVGKLIQDNNVKMKSIYFLANKENYIIIELNLYGHYAQLIKFILSCIDLNQFAILDFVFEFSSVQHSQLKMSIFLSQQTENRVVKKEKKEITNIKNIIFNDIALTKLSGINLFSFSQFRMVGYLQENHQVRALIQSPDHSYAMIKLGDLLGKEHAKVVSVTVDAIQVSHQGMQHVLSRKEK